MRDCDCLGMSPNPECPLHGLGEALRVYSPSAPPDPAERLAAERARFEEWVWRHDPARTRCVKRSEDGSYRSRPTRYHWQGWLAALGLDP